MSSIAVVDFGSSTVRAGLAESDNPTTVFPNIHGRPKIHGGDEVVGDTAMSKRYELRLQHCCRNGMVENYDGFERIIHHTFYNELRVAPEEHEVLISNNIMMPLAQAEKYSQIFFETFNVPAFYVAQSPYLAALATGLTTGLVLDLGDCTQIMPILDGQPLKNAYHYSDFGGADVTAYLARLLTETGVYLDSSAEREDVRIMKEKYGFVAADFGDIMSKATQSNLFEVTAELGNGSNVKLDKERFRCTEVLFEPFIYFPTREFSLVEDFAKVKARCPAKHRDNIFSKIVLSGGSTKFAGFADRLTAELSANVYNAGSTPEIQQEEARELLTWRGGSLFARSPQYENMKITKENYDEYGPMLVHKNCTL